MLRFVLIGACLVVFAGCATTTTLPPTEARHYAAAKQLHEARATRESAEKRAAHYLEAAEAAGPLLGEGAEAQELRNRGSPLATGVIGAIGLSLIHLPPLVVDNIQAQVGHALAVAGGRAVFPPSVHGLSPDSPLLHALDTRSIEAPHHSIIGDRGKGDTPNSSDGVVEYRSSRLDSAHSELIVPGPHGSYQLTETISELQRILRLHLITSDQ